MRRGRRRLLLVLLRVATIAAASHAPDFRRARSLESQPSAGCECASCWVDPRGGPCAHSGVFSGCASPPAREGCEAASPFCVTDADSCSAWVMDCDASPAGDPGPACTREEASNQTHGWWYDTCSAACSLAASPSGLLAAAEALRAARAAGEGAATVEAACALDALLGECVWDRGGCFREPGACQDISERNAPEPGATGDTACVPLLHVLGLVTPEGVIHAGMSHVRALPFSHAFFGCFCRAETGCAAHAAEFFPLIGHDTIPDPRREDFCDYRESTCCFAQRCSPLLGDWNHFRLKLERQCGSREEPFLCPSGTSFAAAAAIALVWLT